MNKTVSLVIRPFLIDCTPKVQALKPLEEAAEIFGAWKGFGVADDSMALEIADCIQACVNLAVRYDIDLPSALAEVEKINRKRGRYDGDTITI